MHNMNQRQLPDKFVQVHKFSNLDSHPRGSDSIPNSPMNKEFHSHAQIFEEDSQINSDSEDAVMNEFD